MSKSRELFEERCSSMPGFNAEKGVDGNYLDYGTQMAWEGWQGITKDYPKQKTGKVHLRKTPSITRITDWSDALPEDDFL